MLEEGTVDFLDLPEEEPPTCVEGKHHVFQPYNSFCDCGVLERATHSPNGLSWILAVWPAERSNL